MAWSDEWIPIFRAFINDMATVPTYDDDTLTNLLIVGAYQVVVEMTFSPIFVVSVANQTITPDPTDDVGNNRNNSFSNLSILKAGSIFDRGQAILATKQAIAVKDGTSSVDLRGPMQGKLKLLEKGGFLPAYESAKLEYKMGLVRVAGAAIMTPFRLYALGYDTNPTGDRYNRTIMY